MQITITDFLTDKQINQCVQLYKNKDKYTSFAASVCAKVIRPNIESINQKLGQENDPMYLAYMIEYILMRSKT